MTLQILAQIALVQVQVVDTSSYHTIGIRLNPPVSTHLRLVKTVTRMTWKIISEVQRHRNDAEFFNHSDTDTVNSLDAFI